MKKTNVVFRHPAEEHQMWLERARSEDRSLAGLIRRAMRIYCEDAAGPAESDFEDPKWREI